MDQLAENERAVIGGNEPPDYGQMAFDEMSEKYRGHERVISELLAEARTAPTEVNDEDTAGILTKLIKRGRDIDKQLESHREAEKEPHLRKEQGVDKYFFSWREKLARRKKTDKPGLIDILYARVDDYNQRKLRAELERRDAEAREAARIEREATAKRLAEEQAARDRLAAAERARKQENIDAHQTAAADHAAAAQDAKRIEDEARVSLHDAEAAAAAKPADMVRARVSDDTILTGKKENYCDVIDVDKLDKDTLWAFVDDAAKVKACKQWAQVTQYKRQMPGANIGQRMKTVIR